MTDSLALADQPDQDVVVSTDARWRMDGRVAIVTGAGGALGRAAARALGALGAIVACVDLDAAAAAATATSIGVGASSAALDVTNKDAIDRLIDEIADRAGRLDVLVNLAGVAGKAQRVTDLDIATFDAMFAVHFKGTLYACQAAARRMCEAGRGVIVNTSSASVDFAPGTIASYSVAKAAIATLTRVLSAEVGPRGVRVNAIAPAVVASELSLQRLTTAKEREAYLAGWAARTPLRRLATAADIGAQVAYLCSDASSFVSGQTLRANGGFTMPW